jgi:hydroxymethylpyrimidine/phosphomethylpyrimidine kinase
MHGRVLIIAGSDSGGGAGIQADIKAVTALNGFAMTAITALTAQNTLGVHGIYPISLDFIRQQIRVVVEDLGCDAVKTGMLATSDVITAVAETLDEVAPDVPLIVDPVMVAKGGAPLLEAEAVSAMKSLLLPRAALITPNLHEAEALLGTPVQTESQMMEAANALLTMGPKAVLLKGGHLDGDTLVDVLRTPHETATFTCSRVQTQHTHGTGCTLASAVACGVAQGMDMESAVSRARNYVQLALATAPGYGQGHGPLNHACVLDL